MKGRSEECYWGEETINTYLSVRAADESQPGEGGGEARTCFLSEGDEECDGSDQDLPAGAVLTVTRIERRWGDRF